MVPLIRHESVWGPDFERISGYVRSLPRIHVETELLWSSLTFCNGGLSAYTVAANESSRLIRWPDWPGVSEHFLNKWGTSTQRQISLKMSPVPLPFWNRRWQHLCGVTRGSVGLHRATFALFVLFLASIEQAFNGIIKFTDDTRQVGLIEMIWERIQGATSQPSAPIKSFTIDRGGLSLGH